MLDTDPPSAIAQDAAPDEGVWIVIPAYNEARTIRGLAEAALALCVRVLVVDDGSSDGTAEQLNGLPLTLLRHPVNRGKAAGLRTAFRHALALGATCVVTIDGDGQHDPRDVAKLLAVWRRQPGPARDRRAAARSRPHSAPALLRQPDRMLLDLLGRRSPDRRHPVGLSRLPARSDGDRARATARAAAASRSRARSSSRRRSAAIARWPSRSARAIRSTRGRATIAPAPTR